jgi:hypothetical protein
MKDGCEASRQTDDIDNLPSIFTVDTSANSRRLIIGRKRISKLYHLVARTQASPSASYSLHNID